MADIPLTHNQLHHLIADSLRAAIIEGELAPGQWLRQRQLAEEFNVSQMPVREALRELAAEGPVEHVPYRGMRVIDFSADHVADLYAHCCLLEGMAARAAATHITPEEIVALWHLHAQMATRLDVQHLAEYRALNRAFHRVIFMASRRGYLIRTLRQLWEAFPTMLWSDFAYTAAVSLPGRDKYDLGEHESIVKALEARDSVRAELLMRSHIETSGRELVNVLRSVEQTQG